MCSEKCDDTQSQDHENWLRQLRTPEEPIPTTVTMIRGSDDEWRYVLDDDERNRIEQEEKAFSELLRSKDEEMGRYPPDLCGNSGFGSPPLTSTPSVENKRQMMSRERERGY